MAAMQCNHARGPGAGRVCAHILADDDLSYLMRFTGKGSEVVLVCAACKEAPVESLESVCAECFEDAQWTVFSVDGFVGAPEVLSRPTALRFEHADITVPALAKVGVHARPIKVGLRASPRTVAVAPHPDPSGQVWLCVTDRGDLARLDVAARAVDPLFSLTGTALQLDEALVVQASPCGRFAAIANRLGNHGVVVDIHKGAVTMKLDRGKYHEDVSDFSLAFFRDGGRTRIIHATDWNRIDISDPETGELLTERDTQLASTPGARPTHDLDYFHAGLTVSPGGRWLVDDGWVWHPVGVMHGLDLARWVHDNVWESEDGPSLVRLRQAQYFWDGPRCFVEEGVVAVGGFGPDDEIMVDGALLFDVAAGKLLRWFAGPPRSGTFVFDGWLFASAEGHGTSVWDVATGERVCHDVCLLPAGYHPVARRFLTVGEGGELRLSALVDG